MVSCSLIRLRLSIVYQNIESLNSYCINEISKGLPTVYYVGRSHWLLFKKYVSKKEMDIRGLDQVLSESIWIRGYTAALCLGGRHGI